MADMESVTQKFEADMAEYEAEVKAGAEEARDFARANEEAKAATDSFRDHALEAAKAAGVYRDALGRLHDENGKFVRESAAVSLVMGHMRDEALAEAEALGRLRDKAVLAAIGMRELKKEEEGAAGAGLLSRLSGIFGIFGKNFRGGFTNMLSNIPGIPGEGGAPAEGAGGTLGGAAAIGAMVPVIAAVVAEADALASGFAAAGAGAGAFYLLAHPAINNLQGDVSALSSANQALGYAQQKYLIDPTKANAKTLKDAQDQYQAVFNQMGQDAGGAAKGVLKLHDEYVNLSNAFQPEAFKVFNAFLKLASDVLPYVTPFAKTFADSITGLLGQADKFAGSKGFKDWLDQFHKLEGPSISAIGEGVGHVAVNIGKLFTIMSSKDVANGINIAFSVIDGALIGLQGTVRFIMAAWDAFTAGLAQVRRASDVTGHDIARAWDEVRHATAELGHDIAVWFDRIRHDAAQWADDVRHDTDRVIGWFQALPGRILAAVAGFARLLWNAGVSLIDGLINGITSMASSAVSAVTNIGSDIIGGFKSVLGIGSPSRVFYEHGVNTLLGYINGVKATAPQLLAAMRGLGGQVAGGGIGLGTSGGGAYGGPPSVHVNMPVTMQGTAQLYNTPAFYQYLQQVVQEAILRYQMSNPGNGLASAWRYG